MTGNSGVMSIILPEGGNLWKLSQETGPYMKIAGLMGTSAILFSTYGQHGWFPKERESELRKIFITSNRYHYISTFAMCAVPFTRNPPLTGTLMLAGSIMFSGAFYYYGVTGNNKFKYIAPIGGICMLLSFLAMTA